MADSLVEGSPIPGTQVLVAEGGCHTLLIGGRSCDAADGTRFNVEDPATERVLTTVANAGAVDASLALDAAVDAGAQWAATPSRARSELLRRA
jgi:succinate-semialdehyde dehydrogenase/glutarate-semialdehyde dehydrogenase